MRSPQQLALLSSWALTPWISTVLAEGPQDILQQAAEADVAAFADELADERSKTAALDPNAPVVPDEPTVSFWGGKNATFALTHCFPGGECHERGTLVLGSDLRTARIDDSKSFEAMLEANTLFEKIKPGTGFYTLKLDPNPVLIEGGWTPPGGAGAVEQDSSSSSYTANGALEAEPPTKSDKKNAKLLTTSMPCSLLKNFEDVHDSLEVSITDRGDILAVNYRTRPAWGLNLFEHTAVRINAPHKPKSPKVPPKPKRRADGSPDEEEPAGIMKYFRK